MTVIDRMYEDGRVLSQMLHEQGEISLLTSVEASLRKTLLLSAASFVEHRIRESLVELFSERSRGDEITIAIIRRKAIERQYHTYFDWESKNANRFFSLFGTGFLTHMKARVSGDTRLNEAILAFLDIGRARNELVHLDFASFPLEKTAEEIFQQYRLALEFVDAIPRELMAFESPIGHTEDQRSS